MAEPGYVYVMTNPAMPGLVKVGLSTRCPERRCNELASTGVPLPFELQFAVFVPSVHWTERRAHELLAEKRVSQGREFFRVPVDSAITAVLNAYLEDSCSCVEMIDISHEVEKLTDRMSYAAGESIHPVYAISATRHFTEKELEDAYDRYMEWMAERLQQRRERDSNPLKQFADEGVADA